MKNQRSRGFTIVELLIVVVVIAILAAITIVSYNGITARARNTQTISAVNAYLKGFAQYATINGTYPPVAGSNYSCLGDNNPGDHCFSRLNSPGSPDDMIENAALNATLKTVMGSLPDPSPAIVSGKNGIMFVNHGGSGVTLDGVQHRYYIVYILEGVGTKCTAGPLLSGGWATFSSTPPSSGITVALSGGSECWIALPPLQ